MDIFKLLSIALGAILANNFIFAQFLGICPFMGVSKKMDTAAGMGMAVIFVMTLASAIGWVVNTFLLMPLGLEYLQTMAYILVIAALVQFVEMFLKKAVPSLYSALGIFLPLITTNCAVLGVVLYNTQYNFNFIQSIVYGFTGGGIQLMPAEFGALAMILPFGGFLTLGVLIAAVQYFMRKSEEKKAKKEAVK